MVQKATMIVYHFVEFSFRAVLASSFHLAELSLTLSAVSLSLPAGNNCDLSLFCQLEVEAATRPDCGGCLNMSVITQAGAESTTANSSNINRINLRAQKWPSIKGPRKVL